MVFIFNVWNLLENVCKVLQQQLCDLFLKSSSNSANSTGLVLPAKRNSSSRRKACSKASEENEKIARKTQAINIAMIPIANAGAITMNASRQCWSVTSKGVEANVSMMFIRVVELSNLLGNVNKVFLERFLRTLKHPCTGQSATNLCVRMRQQRLAMLAPILCVMRFCNARKIWIVSFCLLVVERGWNPLRFGVTQNRSESLPQTKAPLHKDCFEIW